MFVSSMEVGKVWMGGMAVFPSGSATVYV